MIILDFDSENVTYCPKDETATRDDCHACKYLKLASTNNGDKPVALACIYRNVYPEPEEQYASMSKL
jgi:hypothetical protein